MAVISHNFLRFVGSKFFEMCCCFFLFSHSVYFFIFFANFFFISIVVDAESGKQPSVSMSQDCASLNSSTTGPRIPDNGSHASLIPAPRSCTVSIASSFDNFNGNENIPSSSIAEVSSVSETAEGETQYSGSCRQLNVEHLDNLSVLESVGSHDD